MKEKREKLAVERADFSGIYKKGQFYSSPTAAFRFVESAFLCPGQYHRLSFLFFFPTKDSLTVNSNSLSVFKSPVQSKSNF